MPLPDPQPEDSHCKTERPIPPNEGKNQKRLATACVVGILLLLSPWCCCLLANTLSCPFFYAAYGRGPAHNTSKIAEGMTKDEVVALCGQPHKKYDEGGGTERWTYFEDCLGFNYTGVHFGAQGRVTNTWIP